MGQKWPECPAPTISSRWSDPEDLKTKGGEEVWLAQDPVCRANWAGPVSLAPYCDFRTPPRPPTAHQAHRPLPGHNLRHLSASPPRRRDLRDPLARPVL